MDRSLLDAIDVDEGIEEVISNVIEVLEEMLGCESSQKRSSYSENPSQNAAVKTVPSIIRFKRGCRPIHERV